MIPRTPRALVTGAGIRLGAAIARALAARGFGVALHAHRHLDDAEALSREIRAAGGDSAVFGGDFSLPGSALDLARRVEADFGPISALVLSAAVHEQIPLECVTEADLERTWRVNLVAPFLLAQQVGSAMRDRGGGSIVTLLDWNLDRPRPGYLPYEITKAALTTATRGLARALAPGVRVNGLALGAMLLPEGSDADYEQLVRAATPLDRIGSPHDVTATTLFLLLDAQFASGAIWTLDGGRSLR